MIQLNTPDEGLLITSSVDVLSGLRVVTGMMLVVPGAYKVLHPGALDAALTALGWLQGGNHVRVVASRGLGLLEVLVGGVCMLGGFGFVGALGTATLTLFLLAVSIVILRLAPEVECGCFPPGMSPTSGHPRPGWRVVRNTCLFAAATTILYRSIT